MTRSRSTRAFLIGLSMLVMAGLGVGTPAGATGRSGEQLWTNTFNGSQSINDEAFGVAASPDGSRVFVSGYVDHLGVQRDVGTEAIDTATGTTLWSATYDGALHNRDAGVAVAASPDGSTVFVTGYSYGTGQENYVTFGYDAV